MKKNKYYISAALVLIALLLAGAILFGILAGREEFWYCSPSEPRGGDLQTWNETITPVRQTAQPDANFFDKFTISSDNYQYTVKHPYENSQENQFAFEIRELIPGEPLDIAGGTMELVCIGTAYPDANQTFANNIIYRLYDTELRPLKETDIRNLKNYRDIEHGRNFKYNPWPTVQFAINFRGIDDLMFHNSKIFDGRTRELLSGGHGSSTKNDSYYFVTHIPMWHRAPVDVVFDISLGPSEIFEFAPLAGQEFETENFRCRLMHIFDDVDISSFNSSSRDNTMTHEFLTAQPNKAALSFLFACQPTASNIPVTFEFLDKDGEKLGTRGSTTSGCIHKIAMARPLEKIDKIIARCRTRRIRIVIHLPYIPGLPEQNNEIDNLFDVYVPYVNFQDSWRLGSFFSSSLQLDSIRTTGQVKRGSIHYPAEFRDVTIRDIARIYAGDGSLHTDIQNNELILEYPIPLRTKIKQFIDKIFP